MARCRRRRSPPPLLSQQQEQRMAHAAANTITARVEAANQKAGATSDFIGRLHLGG
jgi:hypothetical protein